jgi:hypothetical protein
LAIANPLLAGAKLARNHATHDDPNPDSRSGTLAAAEGWMSEKPSSKKEGEVFFLDIPFYRTPIRVQAPLPPQRAGCQKNPPLRRREKCFFLTSPFIEPG